MLPGGASGVYGQGASRDSGLGATTGSGQGHALSHVGLIAARETLWKRNSVVRGLFIQTHVVLTWLIGRSTADGVWSPWTFECTVSCGGGVQVGVRTCSNADGQCQGGKVNVTQTPCNTDPCSKTSNESKKRDCARLQCT